MAKIWEMLEKSQLTQISKIWTSVILLHKSTAYQTFRVCLGGMKREGEGLDLLMHVICGLGKFIDSINYKCKQISIKNSAPLMWNCCFHFLSWFYTYCALPIHLSTLCLNENIDGNRYFFTYSNSKEWKKFRIKAKSLRTWSWRKREEHNDLGSITALRIMQELGHNL